MNAEIVRADKIKVGDRIKSNNNFDDIKRIDVIHGCGTREFYTENGARIVKFDCEFVTRVLPAPLEVREFWRAVHEDLDGERFGEECETRDEAIDDGANLRVDQFEIEHVRETVLSREEVKP